MKSFEKMWHGLAVLGTAVALAGCAAYDFDAVREMEADKSAFLKALHGEYVRLAAAETAERDWADAVYFNNKARRAALGDDVPPQEPSERLLSEEAVEELEAARTRLIDAIDARGEKKPALAARAQGSFDCWVQEREEDAQPADIAACREAFLAALEELTAFPASAVVLLPDADGSVGAIEVSNAGVTQTLSEANQGSELKGPGEAPGETFTARQEDIDRIFGRAMAAVPAPVVRLILYFKTGGTELTDESRRKLPELLEILKRRVAPEVDVVGHTDRVGSNAFNVRLSRKRAELVRDQVIAIGVEPSQVRATSHGEINPLVPTADEVPEPRNRRVEIVVR